MSNPDLQYYVCCGGRPLFYPRFFEANMSQNPFLLSFAIAFVSYLVQFILALYTVGFPWHCYCISMELL